VWPSLRGPNSRALGEAKPPVTLAPAKTCSGRRPLSGLSSPHHWGERVFLTEFDRASQKLATVCISRTAKIYGDVRSRGKSEKVPNSAPGCSDACQDGERIYVYFGLLRVTVLRLEESEWGKALPLPENPMRTLPNSRGECWCSTIGKTPIFGSQSPPRAHCLADGCRCFGTDGQLCALAHDGMTKLWCWRVNFEPNQRLMAYDLAMEERGVAGLRLREKSTPVVGAVCSPGAPGYYFNNRLNTQPDMAFSLREERESPLAVGPAAPASRPGESRLVGRKV